MDPTEDTDPAPQLVEDERYEALLEEAFTPSKGGTTRTSSVTLREIAEESAPVLRLTSECADLDERYDVHGEIARGGIGVVLRARDRELGRHVAIKMLRERYVDSPSMCERFLEEAQLGAQLEHPGIVPVYELSSTADARPFFAMKLVDGRTLAALLRDRAGLTGRRAEFLSIFERTCQTAAYAHARGVVHRDLKPSNVMIGSFGEVQVVDWGLAKVLPQGGVADEERARADATRSLDEAAIDTVRTGSASVAGSVCGTPAYMAPEQIEGEVDALDERTDVFALGAILCEILTGEPPFAVAGDIVRSRATDTAQLAQAEEKLRANGEETALIELIVACLAQERSKRPHDAGVVAKRIRAHLDTLDERARTAAIEVAAARASAAADRKARRLTVALSVMSMFVLIVGLGVWLWMDAEARGRRDRVARAVEAALEEGQAQLRVASAGDGSDLASWERVGGVAARASSLAASPDATGESRARAERFAKAARRGKNQARELIAERARDDELRQRLRELRAQPARAWDWQGQERRYAALFAELDVRPGEHPVAEDTARLNESNLTSELVRALDSWRRVRRRTGGDVEPILALCNSADPDAERVKLRVWRNESDKAAVLAAADRIDVARAASDTVLILAGTLSSAGEKPRARELLRAGQLAHPRDYWLAMALAQDLMLGENGSKSPAEAAGFSRVALACEPASIAAWNNLGAQLHRSGRVEEARRVFERVGAIAGDNILAWCNHWRNRLRSGWAADEVLSAVDGRIHGGRSDGRVLCQLLELKARVLTRMGRPANARRAYEDALRENPKHIGILIDLGSLLSNHLGDHVEAGKLFRRALDLEPKHPTAHTNLAVIYERRNDIDGAIVSLRTARDAVPTDARIRERLARHLYSRGDRKAAEPEFRAAVELDPNRWLSNFRLGGILSDRGDRAGAIGCYRAALRAKEDLPEVWFNLGWCLMDELDPVPLGEAVAAFRRAVALRPELATGWCHLGLALRSAHRPVQALEALRRGHELGKDREGWSLPSAEWIAVCEKEVAAQKSK